MSWIKELFSSSVGTVIEKAGGAIDRLVTSDEERLALKNELSNIANEAKKEGNRHIEGMEQQITDRHLNDMKSDSWLSKNVRPLTLIFLTGAIVMLAYITMFMDSVNGDILDSWIGLFSTLLGLVYTFYFGSRGIEKITSMLTKKYK
jgi:hypothetical protein